MSAPSDDLRATDGRIPRQRGLATRSKLLDATADLLARTPYRAIKVIDIAREAGTSPGTFYQYFSDVDEAILVLAERAPADGVALAEAARGDWRGRKGWATASSLVEAFMAFWEVHKVVFRVIDLATEEGDLRFQGMRTRALHPLTKALSEEIAEAQRAGRLPDDTDAFAAAAVLTSMLAHVSAHRYGMEFWGIRTGDLATNLSRHVYWAVTGRKPPAG